MITLADALVESLKALGIGQVRQPHTFQLAGHISCLLVNHSGGTMQFAGDLSCADGFIMK